MKTLTVLIVLLVLCSSGRAQTGLTDPVLQRIWRLGMDSSATWEIAQTLLDSIGPRLTGTGALEAASNWIVDRYRAWGIAARREPYGTWRGWRRGYTHVDLVAPRVRSLEATMLAYSPGTHGAAVTGSTVILPLVQDSAAFARWLPSARGTFVLISPAYPSCRPENEWLVMATPPSKMRMDTTIVRLVNDWRARVAATGYAVSIGAPTGSLGVALEKAGAAGVIVSRFTDPFGEAWGTWAVFETSNTRAPAIAMSCEDYGLLYRLTERHGARIRVNTSAQLLPSAPAFNTLGIIPGTRQPNQYVVLSAHLDSWDSSEGATDNGTGTILMMEAMRLLRIAYPHPGRTIIAGHWGGEEQGMIGSRAFAYDHPEIVRGLQAGFNQDGGTGRIQRTWGAGLPDAGAHLQRWLGALPQEFQSQITYNGVWSPYVGNTDHRSFTCYGAPFFNLAVVRWDNEVYTQHTNRDSFDKLVFDDLRGNATIVAMLAYLASEDSTFVARERADLNAPSSVTGGAGGGAATAGNDTIHRVTREDLSEQLYPWKGDPHYVPPQRDQLGWLTTCPKGPRYFGDSTSLTADSHRP